MDKRKVILLGRQVASENYWQYHAAKIGYNLFLGRLLKKVVKIPKTDVEDEMFGGLDLFFNGSDSHL